MADVLEVENPQEGNIEMESDDEGERMLSLSLCVSCLLVTILIRKLLND